MSTKIQKAHIVLTMALFLVSSTGCTSVYYYEMDKCTVALEIRPNDPTAPIQGNIGVKQRIFALVPPKNAVHSTPAEAQAAKDKAKADSTATQAAIDQLTDKTRSDLGQKNMSGAEEDVGALKKLRNVKAQQDEDANGDAESVLSSLRFHKYPKPDGASWFSTGRITIDSALMTGNAAKGVSDLSTALGDLSGSNGSGTSLQKMSVLKVIYNEIAKDAEPRAKYIEAELDALTSKLPDKYPYNVYHVNGTSDLQTVGVAGAAVTKTNGFADVDGYISALETSTQVLNVLQLPSYTIDSKPPTPRPTNDQISGEITDGNDLSTAMLSSPAAKDAAEYFLGEFQ